MKKIMFSDKYGLTQAVLEGRKTQTRRVITDKLFQECRSNGFIEAGGFNDEWETKSIELLVKNSPYKIGEVVAVAQSYGTMANEGGDILANMLQDETTFKPEYCGVGWRNAMFVKADLMPHRIKITNVRVERLQDISDEDCLKEGVIEHKNITPEKDSKIWYYYTCREIGVRYEKYFADTVFMTPRDAYAVLIDKTCGKGTWDSNPWVFVYDFELINNQK